VETPNPIKEIKEALVSSCDAIDFAGSVADLTLDELLSDELLGKIPIVSWIIQGKRVFNSITDRLFFGKMSAFLVQLSKSATARDSLFGQQLLTDPKLAQRFSETILFLLSKLDATQKAAMVAELCKFLFQGRIEIPQFRRLYHVIDSMFVDDLIEHGREHKTVCNAPIDANEEFWNLERYGLMKITKTETHFLNVKTQSIDPCYNGQYTGDGEHLHFTVWKVLSKNKN
jgi:hypothetical protein